MEEETRGEGWRGLSIPRVPVLNMPELKKWSFYQALVAEFMASTLLLFISITTIISQKKQPCSSDGVLVTAWAVGGTTFVMIFSIAGISGACMNPAVTFGYFLARKISLNRAVCYVIVQCLGAVTGVALVRNSMEHDFYSFGGGANVVAPGYRRGTALLAEAMGSFLVVYTVLTATDAMRRETDAHISVMAPLAVGFAVLVVHLATIPITGTGVNPARSFGAAVIYNRSSVWHDQWMFWFGPFAGALAAAAYHQHVIRSAVIRFLRTCLCLADASADNPNGGKRPRRDAGTQRDDRTAANLPGQRPGDAPRDAPREAHPNPPEISGSDP